MSAQLAHALHGCIAELESVLLSLNAERMPHDGDEFHERLEAAKKALAAHEAAPPQEPVAEVYSISGARTDEDAYATVRLLHRASDQWGLRVRAGTKLYAAPQQAQALGAEIASEHMAELALLSLDATALQKQYERGLRDGAQQAQAPGWQLVPVEPTPEMESECMGLLMCESLVYERPHGGLSVETIAPVKLWAAMLKAAPQQGSKTE